MNVQHNNHVELYYELRVMVYQSAAEAGISVAAIAEWALERWWTEWAAGCGKVEVVAA